MCKVAVLTLKLVAFQVSVYAVRVCACVCFHCYNENSLSIKDLLFLPEWETGTVWLVCVCMCMCVWQTEVDSERSALPGTQLQKPYLCVCAHVSVSEGERRGTQINKTKTDSATKRQDDKEECTVHCIVSLHILSCVAKADFKWFGTRPVLKSFETSLRWDTNLSEQVSNQVSGLWGQVAVGLYRSKLRNFNGGTLV